MNSDFSSWLRSNPEGSHLCALSLLSLLCFSLGFLSYSYWLISPFYFTLSMWYTGLSVEELHFLWKLYKDEENYPYE